MLLGYCRSLNSDFTGSNEAYDRALALGVKPDLVYSRKAYNYVRLGALEEAGRCYRAILDARPGDAEALGQLAYVEGKLGNHDAAAECYRRALETSPDDVDFMAALAAVEAKRGRAEAAKELLERANLLDRDNTDVLDRLGVIYMKEGNYGAAIEALERLVSLEPRDARAQRNLGAAHYQTGDKEKALSAFERAMALGGDGEDLYGPLADCYIAMGMSGEALRVIADGIERGAQEAWLYSLWGKILEDAKDYDGAIEKFSRAARAGEAPWSEYARKEIARQTELKEREQIMRGSMQP
jgi:tetratricopeptide (TPR) repeat protein